MYSKKTKMLFITQKIHFSDDDLAFVILWLKEFVKQGVDVEVICLEKRDFDNSFPVYSLGKEKNAGKIKQIISFYKYIFGLQYDCVYVHMNPEYFTLGGWYWFFKKKPMYLWYTHYTMHIHMRLAGFFCKRMFAATKQSLPQYEGNAKKIITGHGIDLDFWLPSVPEGENNSSEYNLVAVHRLCRSKRLELVIRALLFLPKEYNLTVYGREVEKDYCKEIFELVKKENLQQRVTFKGSVPMPELKKIYSQYRLMVNMASETIDKTMIEGMLYGLFPITTKGNTQAIGLEPSIINDDPQEIAQYILSNKWQRYDKNYLQNIIRQNHSLSALITKMNKYIKAGN